MSTSVDVEPRIYRSYSYIGTVEPYPHDDHMRNDHDVREYHYILAFASEKYVNGQGTGQFNVTWNVNHITAKDVRKIKAKFPKVKVVISIGGRGNQYPFNPAFKEHWPVTAIASLKKILQHYESTIDGIDINYEVIESNEADFAHCIGRVITGLMNEDALKVKVVSIAPSKAVRSHYKALYRAHKNDIAWVNYQFYNQKVSSMDDFVQIYLDLLSNDRYNAEKLLPGNGTDPRQVYNLSPEVFSEGCADLKRRRMLNGIFTWNAPFPLPTSSHSH